MTPWGYTGTLPDILPSSNQADLYYALTEALVCDGRRPLSPAEDDAVRASARFVQEQIAALSWRLLVMMRVGLIGFRAAVRLRYFGGFCHLPLARRRAIVAWWAYGPLVVTRKFFRPMRATAVLAYYELTVHGDPADPPS